MSLKEDDVVLCTVIKITKTTVFVKIEGDGEGNIITSEIAPGRIRNLRDYVVPNKKIVCKVLRIGKDGQIDLSLRRVSGKEKQEILRKYEIEKSIEQILKNVLKEQANDIVNKIKGSSSLYDFFEAARDKQKILENLAGKENAERIIKLLNEKRVKIIEVKKNFYLKNCKSGSLSLIKRILSFDGDNAEISYISAGKFVIKVKADNFKEANLLISKKLEEVEKKAKQENCEFSTDKK